jgi:hypothetical protein
MSAKKHGLTFRTLADQRKTGYPTEGLRSLGQRIRKTAPLN